MSRSPTPTGPNPGHGRSGQLTAGPGRTGWVLTARRVAAMARYGVANNLRTPYTWAAAVVLVAMAVTGLYSSALKGLGWRLSGPFLGDGAFFAAVLMLRSGLIEQRTGGLQTFLRVNLLPPVAHMTGAAASLLASWVLLCAALFGLALVLPGGGVDTAAWETWLFVLRTLPLLPFVLVAESVSEIRLPFFFPAVGFFALLLVLVALVGQESVAALVAPPVEPGRFATTLPRLARAAVITAVGFALVLLGTALRSRPR